MRPGTLCLVMCFWCLQASSDEERCYSHFAGESWVTYHGLQGAGVERSRSHLRGHWEKRRAEEDRGHWRARGREERSRSGHVERRGPQEERGQRRIRVPDERSRSRLSGHQGVEGKSSWEDTQGVPEESPFSKEEVASAMGEEEIAAAIIAVWSDCGLECERDCGRKQWGETWFQSQGTESSQGRLW